MTGTAACGAASQAASRGSSTVYLVEHRLGLHAVLADQLRQQACPAGGGWNSFEGSCYKNSAAVTVPKEAITKLDTLKMSGSAVKGGNDTLTFTVGTKAYSTSGKDTVTDLATGWNESEFNIIGDGGGSAATFNSGSSITVKVALTDGSTKAPTCGAKDGTTGETNNLKLGTCKGVSGSTPYIQFTESN